ncbi:hypothetical protein ABVT39_000108 [Epinephelus coioides]
MCLADMRPPRHLYAATGSRNDTLATVFFVHTATGEVLSLLPYVSLSRMYRSSNTARDEDAFRVACANLVLCMLYAHLKDDNDTLQRQQSALDTWWLTGGSGSHVFPPGFGEPRVESTRMDSWLDRASVIVKGCMFCMTGLIDDAVWTTLKPTEVCLRVITDVDVPRVWLGETSRTTEDIKAKLLELGLREPLRVSIVESLRDSEVSAARGVPGVRGPCAPQQGFLSRVTEPSWTTSSVVSMGMCTGYGHRNKRSIGGASLDAPRTCHRDHTAAVLTTLEAMSREVSQKLANSSGSSSSSSSSSSGVFTETDAAVYPDAHAAVYPDAHAAVYPDAHVLPHSATSQPDDTSYTCTSDVGPVYTGLNLTANTYPGFSNTFFVNPERSSATPGPSDDGNVFMMPSEHMGTTDSETSYMRNIMYELYKGQYKSNPDILHRLLGEYLDVMNTPSVPQCTQPQPTAQLPQQPMEPAPSRTNTVVVEEAAHRRDQRDTRHPEVMRMAQADDAGGHTVPDETPRTVAGQLHLDEDREASPSEEKFVKLNSRWKSIGFDVSRLLTFGYTPYHRMTYITCERTTKRLKDVSIQNISDHIMAIPDPCSGLTLPPICTAATDTLVPRGVTRVDPLNHALNWQMGVESPRKHPVTLMQPKGLLVHRTLIPCDTLSCKTAPQTYHAVNCTSL